MSGKDTAVDSAVYHHIFRTISEAVIFSDSKGIIQLWNPGAEALFGFSAEEAIGKNLDLIIPEELRGAHWKGFHHAFAQGDVTHGGRSVITRSLRKQGDDIYVDMSFAIVKDLAGAPLGAVAVARDATERHKENREMRRRLRELEKQ